MWIALILNLVGMLTVTISFFKRSPLLPLIGALIYAVGITILALLKISLIAKIGLITISLGALILACHLSVKTIKG